MLEAKPDAVVMMGPYAPLSVFIKEACAGGLKSQLVTVSFVGPDNLVGEVGRDGTGVVISQVVPFPQDNDLPIQRERRGAVSAHAGEARGFVNFEGCIAAKVLVAAPERAALMDAVQALNAVDLGGLTVSFSPDNQQASNHY